ncbi:unnamed protein product [Gongylonema pulchrum]|uniref:GH131_N domain-containing protein n=1 Tax=Gongylonema pulchrum TaxID=637853 RepID=A0A183DB71_9BILA|nr:unnamed protein product [Gongylonema pulchrum]
MYTLRSTVAYQRVHSDHGVFTYKPAHTDLSNFSRGSYSAFSFSNHYFLAKKMLTDGRVAYYAGVEGKPEQVCIAETLPDEALHLTLFVGTGSQSAHEKIRAQFSPKPEPTVPDLPMTTMAITRGTATSTSCSILIALLLFFMSS